MKGLLFLITIAYACWGCDPARRITMKNVSADTAEITWTASEDSIGFNPFVLQNSKKLKFNIPPGKNNVISLSFGVGEWTNEYIDFFMKYLESLKIVSGQKTLVLDSTESIKNYFISHRKKRGTVVEVLLQ